MSLPESVPSSGTGVWSEDENRNLLFLLFPLPFSLLPAFILAFLSSLPSFLPLLLRSSLSSF